MKNGIIFFCWRKRTMKAETVNVLLMILPLGIALVGLTSAVLIDRFINKEQKRTLLLIVVILSTLIAQNYIEYRLQTGSTFSYWRLILSIYGYAARPFVIILFARLVDKKDKLFYVVLALAVVNALIYLTAFFTDIAFTIDANNRFHRGPLGTTVHIVSGILLVYLGYLSVKQYYKERKIESILPLLNIGIVGATILLDWFAAVNAPISFLTDGVVVCSIFYYNWLHLRFVRDRERDMLRGQNVKLMLSQIQPHFIYNSLSSISELCEIDPKKAQQLTDDFADYLRYNFTALTTEKLIPFEKQLEQVGFYLNIEKTRFGDRINVVYDTQTLNFELPTLTVQPLVENAVRHGICKRPHGGTITIRSYETNDDYIVEIIDDGVGFDINAIPKDGSVHVGIDNVRTRLSYFGDTLEVASKIDDGTTATIKVPKHRTILDGGQTK